MSPRVEISPATASEAVAVPRQVAQRSLASTPRRRAVTLAIAAHSLQPGLAPCPWTLRGTLEALDALKMNVGSVVLLGDVAAAETIFDRGALGHAAHRLTVHAQPSGPRHGLQISESQRRAQIPMAWIGTNLVVLAPLTHRRARRGWYGPCEHALHEFGLLMGYDAPTDPSVRIGGRLVSEIFASSTTIIDAHWWAAADLEGQLCSDIASPEHVLSAAIGEPFGHAAVDEWLAGLLNLRAKLRAHARGGNANPDAVISVGGRRRPWPAAKLETSEAVGTRRGQLGGFGGGLAGRAVKALWRPGGAPAPGASPRDAPKRLAPPLRGPFAELWQDFRPVDLDAKSA